MDAITYPVGESLYLNITNRCTNECVFCIRNKSGLFNQQYSLWLEQEPTTDEILKSINDPSKYEQIVFCGYGEPTIRLGALKAVSVELKFKLQTTNNKQGVTIRLDTNGHGNLFWGRNILPELKGRIDVISISLNAQNAEIYNKICRSLYREKAYPAVIDFIKEARKYIPKVEASVVDLPIVDKEACRQIAQELGVYFRVRPYYEESYVR